MHCGTATPTDPGVPPRTQATGAFEVAQVTRALAGRYRIAKVIGEGGMATVYLAEDQKHQREVAVKVMRPELAATLGADRFLREVQIAAKLNHPNILTMHDSGEADGLLYYVMPYVDGETLKDRLARDGQLPLDEALRLSREIAEALAYAHKRGIVHRDIKPANILLNEGHALIADFGIARAVEDVGGESLTKTGLAVGTPQYMAPEQATGEKAVDGRADIYATGAILFEMLAGEPPFTGQNARSILTKSLTEKPRPVTQLRQGIGAPVDALVQKALAKAPEDRYATATDFVAAIDSARPMSSASNPAITPPQATQVMGTAAGAKGGKGLRVAATAAVALLVLGGAWFALRGRKPATTTHAGPPRVAVLPFTGEGAEDYLVQGVADEVRGRLMSVRGLQLIAPASAQSYKGSTKTLQEIGRELGADYLVGGTVHLTGTGAERKLSVETRLIEAGDGATRWQHEYEAPLLDVFRLQGELASGVVTELGLPLAGTSPSVAAKRPTTSVDAYLLFLKGRSINGRDPAALREAIGFLEQAVSLDDEFSEAWALLSVKCALLYSNGSRDPAMAARSRESYERAIALDPGGHHGLVAKARYQAGVAADPNGARETLDQALRIAPNDAEALTMSGNLEVDQGNLGTSLSNLERARDVDPRSYNVLFNLTVAYQYLGRLQDAKESGAAMIALSPTNLQAVQRLAMVYASSGDLEGGRKVARQPLSQGVTPPALAAYMAGYQEVPFLLDDDVRNIIYRLTPAAFDNDRAWWGQSLATTYWQAGDTAHARIYADSALAPSRAQMEASPKDPQPRGLYGLMLAYLGRAKEARAEFDVVLRPSSSTFAQYSYNLLNVAKGELALGDKDRALDILEQVIKRGHYVTRQWLLIDPTFASLKGYPRFDKYVQGN